MTTPSYSDIARKTVPLPDSSHRPTTDEEAAAERPREPGISTTGAAGPDEATMRDALQALTAVDLSDLQVDVDGGTATMVGSVARAIDRDRIKVALGRVPGVHDVIDQLRIRLE